MNKNAETRKAQAHSRSYLFLKLSVRVNFRRTFWFRIIKCYLKIAYAETRIRTLVSTKLTGPKPVPFDHSGISACKETKVSLTVNFPLSYCSWLIELCLFFCIKNFRIIFLAFLFLLFYLGVLVVLLILYTYF